MCYNYVARKNQKNAKWQEKELFNENTREYTLVLVRRFFAVA